MNPCSSLAGLTTFASKQSATETGDRFSPILQTHLADASGGTAPPIERGFPQCYD